MPTTFSFEEEVGPETFSFEEASGPTTFSFEDEQEQPSVTPVVPPTQAQVQTPTIGFEPPAGFRDTTPTDIRIKSPEEVGTLPSGELSTIFGDTRKPLATYGETMASVRAGTETPLMRFSAPGIRPTDPRIELPKIDIPKEAGFIEAAASEAVNQATGIPEFFTSDLGIAALIAGKVAPRLVSAGFSADLAYTAWDQAKNAYANWNSMTPAEKGVAVSRILGSLVFAGLTAKHAATSPKVERKVIPSEEKRQEAQGLQVGQPEPVTAAPESALKGIRPEEPAAPTIESVSKLKPTEFFDTARGWSKDAMEGKGRNPQLQAEAAARANPDLAAWEKAASDATVEAQKIRDEIKANPSTLMERQTEMMGVAQKVQFFKEGIKELQKQPTLEGRTGFTRKVKNPLDAESIYKHLESEGIRRDNKNVTIVEKQDSPELGRYDPKTGKIEINRSQIADAKDLQWVWDHERAHKFDVENPGAVANIRQAVTGTEWTKIQGEVVRAGYEASQHLRERDARVITTLADAWKGRPWFERLVKRVQLWAGKKGIEMDRVAAERTAVRALAETTKAIKADMWKPKTPTVEGELLGKREEELKPIAPAPKPAEAAPEQFTLRLEPDRIDAVIQGDKGSLVVRAPTSMDANGNHVVDSLTVFVERGILENTFGGTPVQHITLSEKFTGKTAQEARNKAYKAFTDQINKEGFGPQAKPPVAQLPAPAPAEAPKAMADTAPAVEAAAAEPIGMGGALAGEKPTTPQIEQLVQAMEGVRASKAPLAEQVRDAFAIGDRLSTAKDTVGRAISGLKATGDLLIKKWQGIPNIDDLLRAKMTLSKAIESRGWRLQQWEKAAYKAVPNVRDQAAIAKWIDAGGDMAVLKDGFDNAPARYKQAYADAMKLSGDKLTAAKNVQNYFESRLQEAIDAGVLEHGIENYLHRIYENKPKLLKKALAYTQSGLLKTNPALAKKRFFQFDWEAEKAGYTPVQSFIKRITAYEASLSKAIAAREFIKSASEMNAADGRPIIDIKGVGIPVEDAAGIREATMIKPKFDPAKNNEPTLPNGNPNPNYRGDYINRDYRALSRWKWVGTDAGGKPIFVQGDVAIHPDYARRVDALLRPSQVKYGPYGAILRPAMGVSSTIKQTMLDLSAFHPVQITVHGLEHRVLPWKIMKDINLSDPNVEGLLQGGVTLGGDYHGLQSEGLIGSSLTRRIPGLGPVMQSYHQWLFQSYIPRIKMTMALHALERNRARYAGKLTEEQIFHKTANEANAAFGELNYTVLERSKTAQDMARLILLAPDFLEARGRFAAQAFQKGGKMGGNEQRTALLLGALTMWVTARIANKIIDDQYHLEPENIFNIVYDGHAYGLRTVQGDLLHLTTKPMQFWMARLNPVYARTLLEGLTGRDYFGRKRSPVEQAWDAVSTTIPISLRSNRERSLWESLLNGMGVTARRYSDVDDAFKLAQQWKDKNAVPERGEFIYDPNKDVLRPLKLALNHGDEAAAASEIKKLLDSKTYTLKKLDEYFNRYAAMPFTGSKANDKKFVASLTEDQRKTIESARQHKNEIRKLYRQSRGQYLTRPVPTESP